MPYLQFFEDFVMVTPSSSWMFPEDEQKMSHESSIERSVDGNRGIYCLWQPLASYIYLSFFSFWKNCTNLLLCSIGQYMKIFSLYAGKKSFVSKVSLIRSKSLLSDSEKNH